jgi:hypothetical protein
MKQATVVVVNKLGLHARPSAALSQTPPTRTRTGAPVSRQPPGAESA